MEVDDLIFVGFGRVGAGVVGGLGWRVGRGVVGEMMIFDSRVFWISLLQCSPHSDTGFLISNIYGQLLAQFCRK